MTTQAPNFSPKGGVGSIWKDPTGKSWKYTETGWVESGSESIVADDKNKDTFVVKPEDNELVSTLQLGGAKEADIQNALKQRQQILATRQTDAAQVNDVNTTDPIENTIGKKASDPFAGKTRAEVLRDAFNNGVTSSKELDEIGKIYDTLATPIAEGGTDLSQLSPAEKIAAKEQITKDVMTKVMSLPDAQTRQGALGAMTTFKSGKDIIDMLQAGKVKTGLVEGAKRNGVFGVGGRSMGKTSAEEDYFAALTETFAANFRKAMSGTAVSEPEMKRLDKFLPSESKTEQANVEGIMALSDYLATQISLTTGVDVTSLKPDKPEKDPLNIIGGGISSKNNPLGI